MRKFLLTAVLCIVLVGLVGAMPMLTYDGGLLVSKPAPSIMAGLKGDYNALGSGQKNLNFGLGFSKPIAATAMEGKLYSVTFGEYGNTDNGREFKLTERGLYYLNKPGKRLNFAALGGIGLTWEDIDASGGLTQDQLITYLLGASGLALSYPVSNEMGLWGAFEFEVGKDYTEYRAGIGLNLYVFGK